jgi:tetratricopeptide (TPR) repeat protein
MNSDGGHTGKPSAPGSGFGGARRDGRGGTGRPGRRDGRGGFGRERDRGAPGRAGAESALLAILHELERPLTSGDFEAQKGHLTKLLEKLKPLRLSSIDALEFDARTRLFTALLRAGRQPEVQDAEKEARRKEVLGLLGEIWRALGDERRAGLLFAASGRSESAIQALEHSGEWQEVAGLHLKEGRALEAARLLEQKGEHAQALKAYKEAGDHRGWLRAALLSKDLEEVKRAAGALPLKAVRDLLFKHHQGDLYLDILAGRGEWLEIASLYERAEQFADAAQAFERGHRLTRAADTWRKAGNLAEMERCAGEEAKAREGRRDLIGAGEVLRKFGFIERAVELVREAYPQVAFKWLQEGGKDAEAVEFAKAQAQRCAGEGKPAEEAPWLERAGELALAAEANERAGAFGEALRIWEQLGEWEKAGEAAARVGERARAVELLNRAGVGEAEARVEKLAPAGEGPQGPVG